MAKVVRELGRALWFLLPLLVVGVFFLLPSRPATATTYVNPYWSNGSASPWCGCDDCGCERPRDWIPELAIGDRLAVYGNARTGGVMITLHVASTPDRLGTDSIDLAWYSELSGLSQFGRQMVVSVQLWSRP